MRLQQIGFDLGRPTLPRLLRFRHAAATLLLLSAALPHAAAQPGPEASQNMYGLSGNFNPTMAIVVVVLICAFFFMGFFSIYIRQCADGQVASDSGLGDGGSVRSAVSGNGRVRRGAARGLDRQVIEAFPIILYSAVKDLDIGRSELECAVCLNEFKDEEALRVLPKCDHVFHPYCIDAWLASHTTCPVCRANLSPESVDPTCTSLPSSDSNIDLSSHDENPSPEITSSRTQVPASIINDLRRDSHLIEIVNAGETQTGKFPRSHSTGHSLGRATEDPERYTLRLPEEVRRRLVVCTAAYGVSMSRGGSGRRCQKEYVNWRFGLTEDVSRSDRWVLCMATPRVSVWSPKVGGGGDGTVIGTSAKTLLTSVRTPLEPEGDDRSLSRASRPPV